MYFVKCRRTDGIIVAFERNQAPADDVDHIVFQSAVLDPSIDQGDLRWDGVESSAELRPATAQEIADTLDAKNGAEADSRLNDAVLKVLRDLFFDVEARLRAAGQTSSIPDVAAATNKAEFTAALKLLVKAEL